LQGKILFQRKAAERAMAGLAVFLGVQLSLVLLASGESDSGDPLDWLRNAVPGEPGVDYPVLASIQETSFTCDGLVMGGYYADPEQDCQAYHVCLQDADLNLYPVSFLCPNGTVFNQEIFVCDWWFNVDCEAAAGLYGAAEGAFGSSGGGSDSDAGECPAPSAGGDCAGAVSNCWSPGQRDTDCPNNGLCCFDGCADTCVDGPKPQPIPDPVEVVPPPLVVEPVEAETEVKPDSEEPGYEYPVPEVPLELPKPSPPPPGLPTLYGAPPI
jgi:hypothetical protein